ncbi:hypothetical protein D9M68_726050 [compost metagenome]
MCRSSERVFSPKYTSPVSSLKKRMSVPFRIAGLMLEACSSSSNRRIGRRLAYKPSSFLIFNNPCSGRTFSDGSLSYRAWPTAPNRIASLRLAFFRVSSGRGLPVASMAAWPIRASSNVNSCSYRAAICASTALPQWVTSGPIPSPGITKMCFFMRLFRFRVRKMVYCSPLCPRGGQGGV